MSEVIIDISHHQGVIDWQQVIDHGIGGAFVKASDGYFMKPNYTGHLDPQFQTNWTALGNNGVPKGPYHFLRLDYDAGVNRPDIKEQADIFFDFSKPQKTDVVGLDIEQVFSQISYLSYSEIRNRTLFALELFEDRAPGKFQLYTASWWWNEFFASSYSFDYDLWNAHPWSIWQTGSLKNTPINPLAKPRAVNGFDKTTTWQYSWRGGIPGIAGYVDLNKFMLDMTFAEYAGIDPDTPPEPPQPPQNVIELNSGEEITIKAV